MAAGRAVLLATLWFHHPTHADKWLDPAIDATYNDVWTLLMDGLCVTKGLGGMAKAKKKAKSKKVKVAAP